MYNNPANLWSYDIIIPYWRASFSLTFVSLMVTVGVRLSKPGPAERVPIGTNGERLCDGRSCSSGCQPAGGPVWQPRATLKRNVHHLQGAWIEGGVTVVMAEVHGGLRVCFSDD